MKIVFNVLKKPSFWIQLLVWGVIFLMPMMFMPPDEDLTLGLYLRRCPYPLVIMFVFYFNYLWLAPRYLMVKNKQTKFWLIEITTVLILSIGMNQWMRYDQIHHPMRLKGHRIVPRTRNEHLRFFGLLRDFYFISATATLGCIIPISRRWVESEKARQKAEMAKKESEIKNLRNQISPHFLLNTLNNIYALTAFDQQKAQEAVMHLSRMLRHLLYDDEQPYVNLKTETQFVADYIDLMSIRYGNNAEIQKHIDIPEPCSIMIAPMIIISLVENAFKHGISPTKNSEISISITANKQKIDIDVKNTNFPKTQKDKSGHGIGLEQIQKRLELDYSGKYSWTKGTTEDNKYYQSKIILYDTELCNH